MKKILLFLGLFLVQYAYTQTSESVKTENTKEVELLPSPENTSKVYNVELVDTTPEYPGGMSEFYKFVAKNYRVPNVDKLKGKVIVSFIVDKDGTVADIKKAVSAVVNIPAENLALVDVGRATFFKEWQDKEDVSDVRENDLIAA